MLGDGAQTLLFRQARRILEEDRLRYASERGYDVRLLRFEGGDNPHVGILAGVRETARGSRRWLGRDRSTTMSRCFPPEYI